MRKILLIIIFSILVVIFFSNSSFALSNPAAVYCKELGKELEGYSYRINKSPAGEQGICILPDGSEYDEWDFFKGKVGKEYSYCARKGYGIKTENGKTFCIVPKVSENGDGKLVLAVEEIEEIPVIKLMNLDEKLSRGSLRSRPREEELAILPSSLSSLASPYNQSDFSYWDWRDPPAGTIYNKNNFTFFDDNQGWMASIKNQGSCGSCWAFSVVGAVEARYEINQNESRLNPDLSEQYMVTNCTCPGACDGGWLHFALNYTKYHGISDELCFPYADFTGCNTACVGCTYGSVCSNAKCADRCSDYDSRLWTIGGADYSVYYYNFTHEKLQQWIIDYGPVPISLYMTYSIDEQGFLNCSPVNTSNHGVVLMGYNDTGNSSTSYWILKNSWGTGSGQSGYFKVTYDMDCNIGDEVYYINLTNPPNFKPSITLNSPEQNYETTNTQVTFNFTVYNRNATTSSCDLIIGGIVNQTNSSTKNNTATLFTLNLSEGAHNWSIECWENDIGVANTSETRTLTIDATPPTVHLVSPVNDTITSTANHTFSCNITDAGGIANLTLYIWNSSNSNIHVNTTILSGTSNQTYWDYTFGYEGVFKWNCYGCDNSSNSAWSQEGNYTITLDTTPPSLKIISPTNTTYNNATQLVNISSDGDYVWFTNASGQNESYTPPVYRIWNEGSNIIYAYANDSAGNLNSTSVVFTVDTTVPTVHLISPANNTNTNQASQTFTCNITDAGGIANLTLYIWNSTAGIYTNTTALTGTSNETNWTYSLPYEDTYKWNCKGYDNSSNSAWSSEGNYTITLDTIKPTINFTDYTTSAGNYSQNWIAANVSASDGGVGIDTIAIYLHNSTGLVNSTNSSTSPLFINFTSLDDGTYYLNATANDTASNSNLTETRTITLDTTAPTVSLIAPENNSVWSLSANVTFTYNVSDTSDIANCSLILNGVINQTNNSITKNQNQTFTQALAIGQYNWSTNCTDVLGNRGASLTYNLSVGNTAPVINFTSLAYMQLKEDNSNSTINLSNYVTDNEDSVSTINWSCNSNQTNVTAVADNSTKMLNVTALNNWTGYSNITCTAYDPAGLNDTGSFILNVTAVNDPPYFTNLANKRITIRHSLSYDINADDVDSDVSNISFYITNITNITGNFVNFSINNSIGLLTNSTPLNETGKHALEINVTDSINSTLGTFNLTVDMLPVSWDEFSAEITTNFSAFNDTTIQNVTNLTLGILNIGLINFTGQNINLSCADLDSYVNISYNRIEIDSTSLPAMNKPATLYLYNLTFVDPIILRNGAACSSSICTKIDYSGGNLTFNVTSFTYYSASDCGNGQVDSGESCDGTNLSGKSCSSFGYDGGDLACYSDCTFDKSDCYNITGGGVTGATCAHECLLRARECINSSAYHKCGNYDDDYCREWSSPFYCKANEICIDGYCVCKEVWTCTNWTECVNDTQTRNCTDSNSCNTTRDKPETERSCCIENWTCTNWTECVNDTQTRNCTDSNSCGTTFSKPAESKECAVSKITGIGKAIKGFGSKIAGIGRTIKDFFRSNIVRTWGAIKEFFRERRALKIIAIVTSLVIIAAIVAIIIVKKKHKKHKKAKR